MNSINFTANFIRTQTIQRRKPFFRYGDQKVSIVELNREDENDIKALSDVQKNWSKHGGIYINGILGNAVHPRNIQGVIRNHFYALTTQNKNFENLNPKNVLGMMLFRESQTNANKISLLETKPGTNHKKHLRKYKQVGKRLVEFVQDEYKNKDIGLLPDQDAVKFYEALGFADDPENKLCLLWKANS